MLFQCLRVSKAVTAGDKQREPSHRPDRGKWATGTLVTRRGFREDSSRKEKQ